MIRGNIAKEDEQPVGTFRVPDLPLFLREFAYRPESLENPSTEKHRGTFKVIKFKC